MKRIRSAVLPLCIATVASACSGSDPATTGGIDEILDVSGDGGATPDADEDTDPADVDGGSDTGSSDVLEGSDAVGPDGDSGDAGPGGFASPCETDRDCVSGICIDVGDESLCSAACIDTCPDPEWDCRLLDQGGDGLVQLCVPPSDVLCRPCERDLDCGGLDNACADLLDGRFCTVACESAEDCGEGYVCEAVAGAALAQCVPALGVCGGCVDSDGDLHGLGPSCLGEDCDDFDTNTYAGASELCDNIDNDCDRDIDEGFDLTIDEDHCGSCGNVCAFPNAGAECADSACVMLDCNDGWYDFDPEAENGCEYECDPAVDGIEVCNDLDDDCDGEVDEDFALSTDLDNCGSCGNACNDVGDAIAACISGVCAVGSCLGDWLDCDLDLTTGCETNRFDPANCLACGNACELDNATPGCGPLGCTVATCNVGFIDRNGLAADGCEYECTPTDNPTEICDGLDNDCDGQTDNGAVDAPSWFVDSDGDGFGDPVTRVRACNRPGALISDATDCNDASDQVFPGATERCNGIDDNCNSSSDEGLSVDADGDGHYALGSCLSPADDCDDGNGAIYGGAVEVCDGLDNNCDNSVDPVNSPGCLPYFADNDRDGFGAEASQCLCAPTPNYPTRNGTDCYDANNQAYPGQSNYFTTNRGDGSFDYNCDSVTTRQWVQDASGCSGDNLDFCSLDLSNSDGWEGGTPSCGVTRNWVTGCRACFIESGCFFTCVRQTRTSRTQGCF